MIPLRVTFEVSTPWVPPAHGVHLDGLLAWSAAEGCISHPHHTQAMIDAAITGLPLKRYVSADGQWCWMASLLQPANPGPRQRHLATAKTDTDALAEGLLKGRLDLEAKRQHVRVQASLDNFLRIEILLPAIGKTSVQKAADRCQRLQVAPYTCVIERNRHGCFPGGCLGRAPARKLPANVGGWGEG